MSWYRLRLLALAIVAILLTGGVTMSLTPGSSSVPTNGSQQFTAMGGTPPYGFSFQSNESSGSIDPGNGFYRAGATANTHDTIVAQDSVGAMAFASVDVTNVVSSPLSLTPRAPSTPPRGKIDFTASGGKPPYGFVLTVNGSNASITIGGEYTAGTTGGKSDTIRVIDADQNSLTAVVSVTAGVAVSPQGSSVAANGTRTFTATGGAGTPYTWTATAGSIDSDGTFTAPNNAGPVVITADDKLGNTATTTVSVGGLLTVTPADASTFPKGTLQLLAGGGSGAGFTWSLITSPPTGATVDAATGLYTAAATPNVVDQVQVKDSEGTKSVVTIHVGAGVTIAPGQMNVGAGAKITFTATGGSGQGFAFSVPVNPSGGTVDANGNYTAGENSGIDTVKVVDSVGNDATATVQVTRTPNDTTPPVPSSPITSTSSSASSSSGAPVETDVGGGSGNCNAGARGLSTSTTALFGFMLGLLAILRRRRRR